MTSIVRLVNRVSLLVRYHRDWYQIHRRLDRPDGSGRQFPHDYLVNNEIKFNARYFVDNLKHLLEDVEGLCIGDLKLFKEKVLVQHEVLTGPIMYHNEIVGWGVTERGLHDDSMPRPQPTQGSSGVSDTSNRRNADDRMYFRSTKAIAEVDADVSDCTLQCTFKPRPDVPHSFIKFILICHSANKYSLDYKLLESNYYFYAAVVVKLLVMIVGGEIEYREDNSMAKYFRLTIVTSEEVAKAVEKVKEIYDAEYDEFMATVSLCCLFLQCWTY